MAGQVKSLADCKRLHLLKTLFAPLKLEDALELFFLASGFVCDVEAT